MPRKKTSGRKPKTVTPKAPKGYSRASKKLRSSINAIELTDGLRRMGYSLRTVKGKDSKGTFYYVYAKKKK